jgi:hypothetical protein
LVELAEAELDAELQEQLSNALEDLVAVEDAVEEEDSQPRNSVEQEYPHPAGDEVATADPYGEEEDDEPFGGW